MTFIRKFSGDRTAPIIAVYMCPKHGEFTAEVMRNEGGEAPDSITCRIEGSVTQGDVTFRGGCTRMAAWTPTPVACRVRRVEAVKGKWETPARDTYLDTRELGEGMDTDEWQAKRAAVWERKRQEDVMAVKKGFG